MHNIKKKKKFVKRHYHDGAPNMQSLKKELQAIF